jgi:predicted anti-sigma-YlaC factor YlaD
MSGLLDRGRFRRDHRWARARLSDHLDGQLAPSRRCRIERHLGECENCRRLLDGLRRTVDVLHRVSAPSGGIDPLTLAASVRARLANPG